MSKEATGQYGERLGSTTYWSRLNHSSALQELLGESPSYHSMLLATGSRANDAIEEIYEDLSAIGSQIRYVPASNRDALAKQVEGLYDVCVMAGFSPSHSSDCVHALNMSAISPWHDPFRDESAIDNAISFIDGQSNFPRSEVLSMLKESARWSVSFVVGNDIMKKAFLKTVLQNKNESFLKDVAEEYQNRNEISTYAGKCGYSIGSKSYLEYIQSKVFGNAMPAVQGMAFSNAGYAELIRNALRSVADQLEYDLDDAIRQNDYITDETADELKAVVDDLNSCGISTGAIYGKIEKLAWFMGGDPSKILRLQRNLKSLGFGDQLTEDGVYGEKTILAWTQFIRELENGTVPTLKWIDLLQSKHTGITISSTKEGAELGLTNALQLSSGKRYIRIDPPHNNQGWYRGTRKTIDYNHINFEKVDNSNLLYNWIQSRYNHYPLSDDAYNVLKNLDGVQKEIRIKGRKLLVVGGVLDALELGLAVIADIRDKDGRADSTISSAISIGGGWAGSILGAKAGAMLGVLGGPAAPLIIPVLSLVGGIAGSVPVIDRSGAAGKHHGGHKDSQ